MPEFLRIASAPHATDNSSPDGRVRPDSRLDIQRAERCANQIEACWLLDESSARVPYPSKRSNANVSDCWTQPRNYDKPLGCSQWHVLSRR
jgi:hypothetical protein